MKKIVIAAAAAAFLTIGCTKTDAVRTTHFDAINGLTKTVLDGKAVNWESSDNICIIDHQNRMNQFTMRSCNGSSASFVGTVSSGAPEGYLYTAVYPYGSYTVSGSTVSGFSVPALQTGVLGSFQSGLNVSCAQGEADGILNFSNVLTLLKFNIGEGANVADISVTANGGEPLCGTFSILDGAVCNASGSSTVELKPTGSVFDPGDYYIAALPGTLAGGLEINLSSASGYRTNRKTTESVALNPSKIRTIYNAKPVRNGSISGSEPLQDMKDALAEATPVDEGGGKGRHWDASFKAGDITWTLYVHSDKGNKTLTGDNLVFDGTSITLQVGHNGNCTIDEMKFTGTSSLLVTRLVLTIVGLSSISATIGGQPCTAISTGTNVWTITPDSPASGEIVVDATVKGKSGQVIFTSLEVFND